MVCACILFWLQKKNLKGVQHEDFSEDPQSGTILAQARLTCVHVYTNK